MPKTVLLFLLFHCAHILSAQLNKDSIIINSCAQSLHLDEKHHFRLVNTVQQCGEAFIYQLEFFNNSDKIVFVQPANLAIQPKADENAKTVTLVYEYEPPSDGQEDIALMLFPSQKIKRFYRVPPIKDFDHSADEGWKIVAVGSNFSFFAYPHNLPISYFMNKPYLQGDFQHWHQPNGLSQMYILQVCAVGK